VPAYASESLEALKKLVCGDQYLDAESVLEVHLEMVQRLGLPHIRAHDFRDGIATMRDQASGRIMVAQPPVLHEDIAKRAIDHFVETMNKLIANPPAEEEELIRAVAVEISEFLLFHPFVDCNGRLAEALLAAVLRRTLVDDVIVHIGAHQGAAYREWCSAVMTHQLTRSTGDMGDCVKKAIKHMRDLLKHFE
jgi:Fic family protein